MPISIRSKLNLRLRGMAKHISPSNPVRRAAATLWNSFLDATGTWVEFPFHGEILRLPARYRSWNIDYERDALRAFSSQIFPGATIWDIGANIGIYTILAGKSVGPNGKVISWEPHPRTVEELKRHVAGNRLESRCQIIEAAINDGSANSVAFRLEEEATSSRLVLDKTSMTSQVVTVAAKDLDTWRRELGRQPDLLKLDVEGAEALVLNGGKALFSGRFGTRPPVLVAVHPHMMGEFGSSTNDLCQFCEEFKYSCFDLHGQSTRPVQYAEYWLVPDESTAQFLVLLHKAGNNN